MKRINDCAHQLAWKFPVDSEDLIILGYGRMRQPDFAYYVRMQYARRWEKYEW